MKKVITPFRVGLFIITAFALLFAFLSFTKKGGLSKKEAITVYAYFRDASGLGPKSRIQIAGISVGEVSSIALEGNRAKLTMKIKREVGLRVDASLTKRSESLLGDFLIDLYPGSEAAPLMQENAELRNVTDKQGMEAVFDSLTRITNDIQQVTQSLKNVLGGEHGTGSLERIMENMIHLSDTIEKSVTVSSQKLATILENVETVSDDVRGITAGQEQSVHTIVANVAKITQDARDVLGTVKQIVGNNEGDLKDSVASVKQILNRLDHSLQNVETITTQVQKGEGTVGTLLSDKRLGQKISESVEDLSEFVNRLTRLQVEMGIKTEYLFAQGSAKNTLGIRLIPKPDKYYLLELVDDPKGNINTQIVQYNPPALGQPTTQVQRTSTSALKFSAELAKRFYFATLRFGIIESSGGAGLDLHFFNDHLSIRTDVFDLADQLLRYPRLRSAVRFQAFDHLYVSGGIDDAFNRQVRDVTTNRLLGGRDFFLGGGIYFTDADIKAVLTAVPSAGSLK